MNISGAIVLLGKDDKGCYYLIREIARQFEEIDFWLEQAQKIKPSTAIYHLLRFCQTGIRQEIQTKWSAGD